MYKRSFRERAYDLYLLGHNFEQIVSILREDEKAKSITSNTIRNWASETDENGDTWEERRRDVEIVARRKTEEQSVDKIHKLMSKVDNMVELLYNQIMDKNAPKAKTLEGAVFAVKELIKMLEKYEDKKSQNVDVYSAGLKLIEMLESYPELAEFMKYNLPELKRRWKFELDKMKGNVVKEIDITPINE